MKKIKKYMALLLLGSMAFSCSEETLVDQVVNDTQRGLVLRTIESLGDSYDISDTSSIWGVTLEAQDAEQGKLFSEVKAYVSFVDNTRVDTNSDGEVDENDDDFSTGESLVKSVSASSFTVGPFGLPRGDVAVTYAEAQAASGVDVSKIDGGDSFSFRLEGVLSDGRVYTSNANGTVTGGSFFASPFAYVSTVVCPPAPPAAGDWIFDMVDAYGDSWNGASLTVTLDGTEFEFLVDDAEATASTETLTVPPGSEVISIKFNSGAFDGEVQFTVTSANGNVILSQVAYGATTPAVGVELINYCVQNY